jgi:DNA primase
VDALFNLLREGFGAADRTPEQSAAFRARLEGAAARITDKTLASEYRRALLDRFFAARTTGRFGSKAKRPLAIVRPPLGGDATASERGRLLVATLLRHPDLLDDVEEAFHMVALPPNLAPLRDAMLGWAAMRHGAHEDGGEPLDSAHLMDHLTHLGLAAEAAHAIGVAPLPPAAFTMPDAMPAEAEAGWWHIFGLMHRERLEEEVIAAMRDLAERPDQANHRRVVALCTARNTLRQGGPESGAGEDDQAADAY